MNLKNKLIYIISALIILPLGVFLYISNYYTKNIMIEDKVNSIDRVLDQNIENAEQFIDQYKAIVRLTSQYPPIQGIIRSKINGGIDPIDGSSIENWKKRLQSIFSSQLEMFDLIYQIRYLDEKGQEIVRVQKNNNNLIKIVPEKDLQNKSHRYYFQKIIQLQKNEVYLSPADLNVEGGQIQEPHLPTIRFCTKILSETDQSFKGSIILNVNVERLFNLLSNSITRETFVINQDGYFLSHPDVSKIYGSQLGTEENYFQEQPEIEDNVKKKDYLIFYDKTEKEYRIWKKIYYLSNNTDQYWIVIHKLKENDFLSLFYSWHKVFLIFAAVSVIFICLLAWFLAGNVISPIVAISQVASRVKKGSLKFDVNPKLKKRRDEIGELTTSIEEMGGALLERSVELDKIVEAKTVELQERMEELEKFNKVMVGREKRMVELKHMINELSVELGRKPPFDMT